MTTLVLDTIGLYMMVAPDILLKSLMKAVIRRVLIVRMVMVKVRVTR